MFSNEVYLLVTCLISISTGIRVDWNTNKGPIVPPTPRTTTRPNLPYREPAPVWEDQSDDIPNPNPYVYVLPPPSRPRPATNNYLTSDRRPVTQANYNNYNNNNNYGQIIAPNTATGQQQQQSVASLAARYVPNVGIRYYAVVPNNAAAKPVKHANGGVTETLTNGHYFGSGSGGEKPQGKYNAKTKKYKVYTTEKEKPRYAPVNYYSPYEFALPLAQPYNPVFNQEQLLTLQQLPLLAEPQPFRAPETPTPSPSEPSKQSKFAYFKDVSGKPKPTFKSNKQTQFAHVKPASSNAISHGSHS